MSQLRDSTPCRPKGCSALVLFWDIHFWLTELKNFLKEPLTPIFNSFEVKARAKNSQFFGQNFRKNPKNAFFGLFVFQKLLIFSFYQKKVFLVIWKSIGST